MLNICGTKSGGWIFEVVKLLLWPSHQTITFCFVFFLFFSFFFFVFSEQLHLAYWAFFPNFFSLLVQYDCLLECILWALGGFVFVILFPNYLVWHRPRIQTCQPIKTRRGVTDLRCCICNWWIKKRYCIFRQNGTVHKIVLRVALLRRTILKFPVLT